MVTEVVVVHCLFMPGMLAATPAVMDHCERAGVDVSDLLVRHTTGDWGDLDAHDKRVNDFAVTSGGRILSRYMVAGEPVYFITHSYTTTIMLASEY